MTEKPPIGIMPKRLHQGQRFEELTAAIMRYIDVSKPIPNEWIEEYNELAESLSRKVIPGNTIEESQQEPKEEKKINLKSVEDLLNTINETWSWETRVSDDYKAIWRHINGYSLEDLK